MIVDEAAARLAARQTAAEIAFVWFQRVIAAYCLVFGLLYWVRLIGFYDGPLWRFDLMPVHWQVAAVTLAVFFPFAAIGLWMLSSWGPVIWFICAATESAMHLGWPQLFGASHATVAAHAGTVLLYLAFVMVISRQRRLADVSDH